MRRTRIEHIWSALPPLATEERTFESAARCQRRHMRRSKLCVYSITLSASCWSCNGISSPSALAVFMLMLNTSLVGNSTGNSAGLAPFRILSASGAEPAQVAVSRQHEPRVAHAAQCVLLLGGTLI